MRGVRWAKAGGPAVLPSVLLSVLLLLAVLPLQCAGSAGTVRLLLKVEARLPEGNYRASSVLAGDEILLFGGRNGTGVSSTVVAYDIVNGKASRSSFGLPQPRMASCAAYDGRYAYVFGGSDGGLELDSILRIDPASGNVTTLDATLPSPRIGLAAAMRGGYIYLFGGHSNGTMLTEVLRFDPSTENIGVMNASLPTGRAGMSAASETGGIYLFGGNTDSGGTDEVLLYEPDNGTVSVLPARLPYPVYHAPAVDLGGGILLPGGNAQLRGWSASKATDTIIRFDPATGRSVVLGARLPSPRERAAAESRDGEVIVLGGQQGVKALDEVVSIRAGGAVATPEGGPQTALLSVLLLTGASVTAIALAGRRRN